jgi:hypothetical protein
VAFAPFRLLGCENFAFEVFEEFSGCFAVLANVSVALEFVLIEPKASGGRSRLDTVLMSITLS